MIEEIRVLSLTQPWATLTATGEKKIETRSWRTHYRGLVAIHAAGGFPRWASDLCGTEPFFSALLRSTPVKDKAVELCPRRVILGVVRIKACRPIGAGGHYDGQYAAYLDPATLTDQERAFGDYTADRYAWLLAEERWVFKTPIPCNGALGLWTPKPELLESIREGMTS